MSPRRPRGSDRPLVVDPATSARLGRVRQKGTSAEEAVRALLRQLGVRSGRSHRRLPGSPDIVNLSAGWAIFVHGCFWHAHPGCKRATVPKRNRAFWARKLADNRVRDARVLRAVRTLGLRALVVWECDVEERSAMTLRRLARFVG
jgi:DNA mismatch endonuclease (patch repair protein)